MRNLRLLLVTVLGFQLHAALAAPATDRLTVTVRGKGPDVVLIPGLACSGAVWDATAKQLEGQYRLHIVQVAGFGSTNSGANASGAVVQPTADAIALYINTNHLKSPAIIGHSLGGLMGMMLAIQHPEDVGKLMIVDSFPFFGVIMGASDVTNVAPQAASMRDTTISQSQDEYADAEKQFLPILVKSQEGLKSVISWAVASDKSVVGRALYETMTTDLRPSINKIKAPVTLLYPWDSESGLAREDVDKLYHDNFKPLSGAKLVCVEDSRHFIMLDQPAKFAAQLDTFLKP